MSDTNVEPVASVSKDAAVPPADAANTKTPGSPLPLLMIGLAVGALAAGGALGLFVVGPQVVAARTHAPVMKPAESAPPEESSHSEKSGKGKDGAKLKPVLYKVDNIIVNPAGAQGSHFLMASVVFEVPEDKIEERLRDHEAQVRDVVVSALESKSMDDLIRPGARERLKSELGAAIRPIAGNPAWIHVYLPQFVIQ